MAGSRRRTERHTHIEIRYIHVPTDTHPHQLAAEKRFKSYKLLDVYITEELEWLLHTDRVVKKVQLGLFKLRRLNKFVLVPKTLTNV